MLLLRRTIVSMTLAIAAACGRDRERAPAAGSTGATAAPAPVAAAGPASAPQVTPRGIGAIRAWTTVAEASKAVGGALIAPPGADSTGCGYLEWRGGPPGVRVMVEGGRIARVEVDSAGILTAAGVAVGDSEPEVQRRYGGRAVVSPQKYTPGHYLTVVDPSDTSFALVFETSAGRVTRYRAGRRPQVEYVEGCG